MDELSNIRDEFQARLKRLRLCWQAGLCLRILLKISGLALVMLTGYAVLDFFLAFPAGVRTAIGLILISFLVLLALYDLVRVLRRSDRDMALRADRLLASRRKAALSGLELCRELDAVEYEKGKMRAFLLEKGVQRCFEDLKRLRPGDCFPKKEIIAQLKVLGIQFLLAGVFLMAGRAAAETILERVFFPARDVPPHSKYVFDIQPPAPLVVYGGDAEVKVEITGAPVDSRVWMATRHGGATHRAACFQESDRVFAQRMEKVVVPLEFCFRTGRARSKWHKIDLRLQPRIAVARAEISPPAYTRLPTKSFYLGHEEFAAYANSKCRLEITSNRPLLDGTLTVDPVGNRGDIKVVQGEKSGAKSLAFEWEIRGESDLEIAIRDVRGTPADKPLEIHQKIVPDEPPSAVIDQPAGFVMATPNTTLPLTGYSEDDLGLARVELVRGLVGYRDRVKQLGPALPSKRVDVDETLDLARLGVAPGDVLELYLEASDLNPSLMGVSASPVVRVSVISKQEYVESLRMRETLENFLARFRMVSAAINEAREELSELQEKLASGDIDEEELKSELAERGKKLKKLGQRLVDLGADFPIYEMEKRLYDFARQTGEELADMGKKLGAEPNRSALEQEVGSMLDSRGGAKKKMARHELDAGEVASIRRLMSCAGQFMNLLQRQEQLVNRLERFSDRAIAQDLRLLAALGRRQKEIRAELKKLTADIRQRSQDLDEKYAELKRTALKFADTIDRLEIPPTMKKSSDAAANQDGRRALRFARLALEKLRQLQSNCDNDAFGGMCQGGLKFGIPKPSMRQTLEQMMSAMTSGASGVGGAGGAGVGIAGGGPDGYAMQGHSPINVPMYGPERISRHFSGASGSAGGAGGSGRSGVRQRVADGEAMSTGRSGPARGESLPLEKIPGKYIDAVKRYFSGEDESLGSEND